jgi:N-acetylglucosaminyl-diphospho-decaprenol L-rhamnosyltransferase
MTPKASIIIVNWNSLRLLRECLRSILDSEDAGDLEIIVVDNGSAQDETVAIQAEYPSVITIRSETNLGFARANNLGYDRSSAANILFLNPDTRVIGSAIHTMMTQLRSTPGAGIMGCKLLNTDGSVQTSCIQRFPTILNQCLDLEFLRLKRPLWKIWGIGPLFSDTREPAEVEVVSGACLMITRETFERIGRFREQYFMYAEDVDLCYRARQAGWKVYFTGQASVIHHGGGTSRGRNGDGWVAIMQRQAILRFCREAHGRLYATVYRAAMGFNAGCRLILLLGLFPFRRIATEKQIVHSTSSKWLSVLKWAIGLDRRFAKLQGNA